MRILWSSSQIRTIDRCRAISGAKLGDILEAAISNILADRRYVGNRQIRIHDWAIHGVRVRFAVDISWSDI
jgi:hypothetical protein